MALGGLSGPLHPTPPWDGRHSSCGGHRKCPNCAAKDKRIKELEAELAAVHGMEVECATCGAPGQLDTKTQSGKECEFSKSVWWNTAGQCECWACWLK